MRHVGNGLRQLFQLLETQPDVRENYQERFRYIMVDEYQDTNTVQFRLVSLLAGKYRNLCVVGDDDQSIYKFRGANIRNILDFEKEFSDAKVIKLEQNYRSVGNVLEVANSVIRNNKGRKEKTLWTDNEKGEKIRLRQFDTAKRSLLQRILRTKRHREQITVIMQFYTERTRSRVFLRKSLSR